MTVGERCDEIVRLIDETLLTCEPTRYGRSLPSRPPRGPRPEDGRSELELDEDLPRSA